MTTWKIAVVGSGYMAQEHTRAFASLPGVAIVGIVGRNAARAQALAATCGARAFSSISAMHHDTQADVVVVAVNELSMAEVCSQAFEHPWLCLLEKPVGIDIAEARAITTLARRKGTRAFVALNRRSYSSTRQALHALTEDDGPRLVSVLDQQDMASARASGTPEAVVQNYMYANSIHLIDYFNLFGRGQVTGVNVSVPWTAQRPGFVVATVHYSSGDTGVYQSIWNGPGPWSVTVTNPSTRLELRPLEKLGIQRRGERALTAITPEPLDTDFKPGLLHQARQIVGALTGKSTSLANLDEALCSMVLCADIYGLQAAHGA